MLRQFRILALLVVGVGAVLPAPQAAACFSCYCNGHYLGCYNDVWACYSDCMLSDLRSDVDSLEQHIFGRTSADTSQHGGGFVAAAGAALR